jgi:ADP-ribose pyrophosphatase
LEEETGYKADHVLETSPTIVSDPGMKFASSAAVVHTYSGMTNANMKLVTVSVTFEDRLETPKPKLEDGEHIETRVIPLCELHETLLDYDRKVMMSHSLDQPMLNNN